MSKFSFVIPSLYKGLNADDVAAEFDRIREVRGDLKPEFVVDESRDPSSLLHNCFQWDDTVAADEWRREQARRLIKNVYVVVSNEEVHCEVRAFVNVQPAPELPRSYTPIREAIHNEHAYQDLLAQAKTDMQAFCKKYAQLSELNAIKAEMLKFLAL